MNDLGLMKDFEDEKRLSLIMISLCSGGSTDLEVYVPLSLSGTTWILSLCLVLPKKIHWPSRFYFAYFPKENQRQHPALQKHNFNEPRAKGGGGSRRINFSPTFSSQDLFQVARWLLAPMTSIEEQSGSFNKVELSSNQAKGWLEASVCLMLDLEIGSEIKFLGTIKIVSNERQHICLLISYAFQEFFPLTFSHSTSTLK